MWIRPHSNTDNNKFLQFWNSCQEALPCFHSFTLRNRISEAVATSNFSAKTGTASFLLWPRNVVILWQISSSTTKPESADQWRSMGPPGPAARFGSVHFGAHANENSQVYLLKTDNFCDAKTWRVFSDQTIATFVPSSPKSCENCSEREHIQCATLSIFHERFLHSEKRWPTLLPGVLSIKFIWLSEGTHFRKTMVEMLTPLFRALLENTFSFLVTIFWGKGWSKVSLREALCNSVLLKVTKLVWIVLNLDFFWRIYCTAVKKGGACTENSCVRLTIRVLREESLLRFNCAPFCRVSEHAGSVKPRPYRENAISNKPQAASFPCYQMHEKRGFPSSKMVASVLNNAQWLEWASNVLHSWRWLQIRNGLCFMTTKHRKSPHWSCECYSLDVSWSDVSGPSLGHRPVSGLFRGHAPRETSTTKAWFSLWTFEPCWVEDVLKSLKVLLGSETICTSTEHQKSKYFASKALHCYPWEHTELHALYTHALYMDGACSDFDYRHTAYALNIQWCAAKISGCSRCVGMEMLHEPICTFVDMN